MENLIIKQKKDSLNISCSNGKIDISGNSILQNPITFFKPVIDWVNEYVKNPAERTEVTLKFEYIDTASVHSIYDILKSLKKIPGYENRLFVNWHFEYDDPELLEVGEIMEGRLHINFNYIEYKI